MHVLSRVLAVIVTAGPLHDKLVNTAVMLKVVLDAC